MKPKLPSHGSPLFTGLPPEKIDRLLEKVPRKKIPQGTLFVKAGKRPGKVYWLLEGNVTVQWEWQNSRRLTAFINTALEKRSRDGKPDRAR